MVSYSVDASMIVNINSPVTIVPEDGLPLSCGFEQDFCSFTNSREDVMDWDRSEQATPSAGTGPSTARDGRYFLFMETSGTHRQGDQAVWV